MDMKYLDDEEDGNEIVPPGGSVKVPMTLADSRRFARFALDADDHRPHYGRPDVSDARAAARDARNEMIRRAERAWRTLSRDAAEPDASSRPVEWQRHLRGPRPGESGEQLDPNAAHAVEQELERWQGHDPAELSRDVEARRRKQHAEFGERLSNAWRGGK
jgi:hypothetical protein